MDTGNFNIAVVSDRPDEIFSGSHPSYAIYSHRTQFETSAYSLIIIDIQGFSGGTPIADTGIMYVSESFTAENKDRLSAVGSPLFAVIPITAQEVASAAIMAELACAANSINKMLIIADSDGIISYMNRHASRTFGDHKILSQISPEIMTRYAVVHKTGVQDTFEIYLDPGWDEIHITPLNRGRTAVFITDITARKLSEKSTSLTEKRHMSLAVLGQMYEAEFEDILEYALDSALEQSESQEGAVCLVDKDTGALHMVASYADGIKHLYSIQQEIPVPVKYAAGMSAVMNTNEPLISNDRKNRYMIVPVLARGGASMMLAVSGRRSAYSMSDATGLIHYMESVWRLKERKDAEEEINKLNAELEKKVQERTKELAESENRFRTAFESTSNGMAIFSLDGIIMQVNRAFAGMLGFTPGEMHGKQIAWFTHKEFLEMSSNNLKNMALGLKDSYSTIKKYRHKNGTFITLSVNSALARDSDGRPLYIVAQLVDITDAERTRTERDRIFEHSHDIICVTTFSGEIRYANGVYDRIFAPHSKKGKKHNLADIFSRTDTSKAKSFLSLLLSGENIIDYESEHTTAGGETIWLSWFASADSENRLVYAIARDITERKKYETRLTKARDEAERANRSKSEFIANISHEIRTPLNAVIGFSELLAARETDEKSKSFANAIKSGGKTLLNLINDILDISKLEAGAVKTETVQTDIRYLLKEIVSVFSVRAATKGLSVTGNIDETVPAAMMLDVSRLRQILLNLVGNAVKFTENGFVKIHVTAERETRDTASLRIHVTDSGIGIPESEFDTIFEPFRQRSDRSMKEYGGTGLGLSISRKLAEIMSGRITVKSFVGHGSTFTLSLPGVKVCSPHPLHRLTAFRTARFSPASVLVADDDEMSRNMLREMLESMGLTVLEAQNGAAAHLIAKEALPALIFMDIRMPDMDGYRTAELIRANPKTAEIPIIAVTAAMEEENRNGLFDDFLYKPADMDMITACASKYLKMNYTRLKPVKIEKPSDKQTVRRIFAEGIPKGLSDLLKKAPAAVDISYAQKLAEHLSNQGETFAPLADAIRNYTETMDIDKLKQLLTLMRKYAEDADT